VKFELDSDQRAFAAALDDLVGDSRLRGVPVEVEQSVGRGEEPPGGPE
jgi:hypothetical protein